MECLYERLGKSIYILTGILNNEFKLLERLPRDTAIYLIVLGCTTICRKYRTQKLQSLMGGPEHFFSFARLNNLA